jgi:hypothetical protein
MKQSQATVAVGAPFEGTPVARRPLSRWRAAGIHLMICGGIAAAVLALMLGVWYAALLYGCHVVALARPAFIVFVKDQFQVATVAELDDERFAEARYAQFRSAPWTGPRRVYGEWPKDPADRQRLIDAVFTGEDLHRPPG